MHPRLVDRGVVVTGAGRGIGRALAARMAAEGARVVVNGRDPASTRLVAEEIGGTAVVADAATAEGIDTLIREARSVLGRIDVFCANAGIERGGGRTSLQTPDDQWEEVFEVNVMAHVRAARLLVPQWLQGVPPKGEERPLGRFVITASAAGLLTMLGNVSYSVTKHAAVGFAEWLAITYGYRGVAVQAICPQAVKTPMLEEAAHLQDSQSYDSAITPEEVAEAFVDSLAADRFLVLPHPEVADYYISRATDTDRWLAGMARLQERLDLAQMSRDEVLSTEPGSRVEPRMR